MPRDIVKLDGKRQLYLPGMTLTPVGIKEVGKITQAQWEEAGDVLGEISKRCMWFIGDWYRIGAERKWGETYDDCQDRFGIAERTASNATSLCREFDFTRRRVKLPYSFHQEVQGLPHKDQDLLLDECEVHGWTQKELRAAAKEKRRAISATENLIEDSGYRIVYADPPWKYGDERGTVAAGGASAQYPLMSIDELCMMNVHEVAAKNAVLFLWVTVPLLAESMEVISAWGFEYKTHIVWDKKRPYYGNYSHVQHEILCICTRGSCVPTKECELPRSIIAIDKGKHSAKPHEFYDLIETLYPRGKRIELFARNQRDGWDSWGNEIGET